MNDKPILFSGPMVRGILDGRKTQTRRVVRFRLDAGEELIHPLPRSVEFAADLGMLYWTHGGQKRVTPCPYGVPGDLLWVRETWCPVEDEGDRWVDYRATPRYAAEHPAGWENAPQDPEALKWKPSIHMPRWASRIALEVTNVRVERLQEITEEDARAEGVQPAVMVHARPGYPPVTEQLYGAAFEILWNRINGKRAPWTLNPYVWVVEFKRLAATDEVPGQRRGAPASALDLGL